MNEYKTLIEARKLSESAKAIALQWVDEETGEVRFRWHPKQYVRQNAGAWEVTAYWFSILQTEPEPEKQKWSFKPSVKHQ
jgi:hypothetical protein